MRLVLSFAVLLAMIVGAWWHDTHDKLLPSALEQPSVMTFVDNAGGFHRCTIREDECWVQVREKIGSHWDELDHN